MRRRACLFVVVVWLPGLDVVASETNRQEAVLSETSERWFSGSLLCEFASSYLASSGSLCDTRPICSQELDGKLDLREYGWIDGYGWIVSSLHDKQKDQHRAAFNEFEGAVRYGYLWQTTETTSVSSQFGWLWNPQIGYPDDDENYNGPVFAQSFENPYLVPYYNGLWLIEPKARGRIRVGVRRSFRIADGWTLRPSIEAVWSDYHRYVAKYGQEPEVSFFDGGFSTERFDLMLRWQIKDSLGVYAQFQQFMVLGRGPRKSVRGKSAYYAKTDWALGIVGVEYSF